VGRTPPSIASDTIHVRHPRPLRSSIQAQVAGSHEGVVGRLGTWHDGRMMDANPDSPWNPRIPVSITPTDFERLVLTWLERCAEGEKQRVEAEHLGIVQGRGGDYKIDALVKLTVFRGALVIVLVECKHQTRPVEREDVMVLQAKVRDVGAHKGMLFSTSGFQSGALEYARAYGIATVTVVAGKWLYETKAFGDKRIEPPPWAHFDPYAGIRVTPTENGVSSHTIEVARVDALLEWFSETEHKQS